MRFYHRGMHFSNIITYKSGFNTSYFVDFDIRMCISPQQRAFFDRRTAKSTSDLTCFVHFHLKMWFFVTPACNFWFFPWPPDPAPPALTGLLFDWWHTNHWKKRAFRDFSNIWHRCIFFSKLSDYCIFCRCAWLLYCWFFHLLFNSPFCWKFLLKFSSIIRKLFICLYKYL